MQEEFWLSLWINMAQDETKLCIPYTNFGDFFRSQAAPITVAAFSSYESEIGTAIYVRNGGLYVGHVCKA